MVAQLLFTDKLVEQLTFDKQVVGVTKAGRPIIEPTPKEVANWMIRDTQEPGLFLRLTPSTTSWCIRKRFRGNTRIRTLGHAWSADPSSSPLTLAKARKRARKWLDDMEEGTDPLQVRKEALKLSQEAADRERLTMAVAMDELIETRQRPKVSGGRTRDYSDKDRRMVKNWLEGSPMWKQPVVDLDLATVRASLDPIVDLANGRPKRCAWGPQRASHATLQKIYIHAGAAWAMAARTLKIGDRKEGPINAWKTESLARWPEPGVRETPLDTGTLSGIQWMKALLDLQQRAHDPAIFRDRPDPRTKGLKPHTGVLVDFYLLVCLWGSRRSETAVLEWKNVHFDKHLVILNSGSTKHGKRDSIPLTEWAADILRKRKAMNELWRPDDDSPYVFPSRQRGLSINDPRGIVVSLSEETGLMVNAHDLRRTVANEIGEAKHIQQAAKLLLAGTALHHGGGKIGISSVTELYLSKKAEALRPIYQEREDKLRKMLGLPLFKKPETDQAEVNALLDLARKDPEVRAKLLATLLQ